MHELGTGSAPAADTGVGLARGAEPDLWRVRRCPAKIREDAGLKLAETSGGKNSWPYKTDEDLRAAGYVFENTGICRGETCRQQVEWWLTPKQKHIPLDPGTMQPHWSTCPDAPNFRKDK